MYSKYSIMFEIFMKVSRTSISSGSEEEKGNIGAYDLNSPAITTTMIIAGNIVNRLASNSNTCKTLCATLVGAIIGLQIKMQLSILISILLLVMVLAFTDSMYVSLKKHVDYSCKMLRENVEKKHKVTPLDIPHVKNLYCQIFRNMFSKSVAPFYAVIIAIIFIIKFVNLMA